MARGTIDKIEEKSNLSEITIKENTIIKGTIVPSDKFILIRLSNEDKYGSKDSAKSILQIGNIIKISGKAFAFEEAGNPGQFDAYRYYIRKGYAYSVMADAVTVENRKVTYKEYARKIRNSGINIIENNLPEDEAGILSAMLFGSKGGLAADDKELYQKNGIMHIMAVSGVKTLKLDIPLVPETRINWAFVPLHIAIIYILKLCLDEEIIPRCRFPCSRGYLIKCINWQKKQ